MYAKQLGELSETRSWAYILILPSIVLIFIVIIYPVFHGVSLSFQEMQLTKPHKTGFVGLKNYYKLFTDEVFLISLKNTGIWVTVVTILEFSLGLLSAVLLNRAGLFVKISGVLILLPWILPSVVAANIWALMLDSRLGVLNDILYQVGLIREYVAWFAEKETALISTMLIEVWKGFPFFSLLLLAGLQSIDDELYEAGRVDGASDVAMFWYITLPMLKPVIVATIVLRVISLVNSPDLILILTNGGPGYSTHVLSLYAFLKAYSEFNFGYSGTISVFMFLILIFFTILYVRMSRLNS
ncbi:MAG: sugar ABC transporter permease [Deltaproteobacteria bacterium]